MTFKKVVAVVVFSAGMLALSACGSETGDGGGAGSGGFMMLPVGAGGMGGVPSGTAGVGSPNAGMGGMTPMAGIGAAGAAGAGGMGGASGMGGMGGMAGAGMPGTGAVAELMGIGGQMLTGKATFMLSGMNVALVITLTDCTNGIYPVHIHEAASCESAMSLGEHWGGKRGEGIPAIVCDTDMGMQTHMRMGAAAETKWTIGTRAADDLIGHVMVLHGASGPIACGVIKAQ